MTDEKEKKGLLLRLPEPIYKILKRYKQVTGTNITSTIQQAIVSWCFIKGLITLEDIKNGNEKEKENDK